MTEKKHSHDTEMEEQENNQASEEPQSGSQNQESDKIAELNDKYLRLYSDFDNYRKRTNKERSELIQNANQDLLLKLLPVYDDFERAISTMEQTQNPEAVKEGVLLIFSKFQRIMQGSGLQEIKSVGEEFDPELHEAIAKIPAPQASMKGKIIDQAQKGYTLNDKIIRHAKVVVGE
jgi:molecular chaperone GrpE